jgi:formate hydrogenlyase subunit 3/multisubunit Na+/H+ antiporter MnhD subunit
VTFPAATLGNVAALVIAFTGAVIAVYSVGFMRDHPRRRAYWAYLLATVGLGCGAVLATDWLVLLVCWGALALALYLMVGLGGPSASAAAQKSFFIVGGADALFMLGVVLVWIDSGTTSMTPVSPPSGSVASLALACFAAAAFAKAGAVPLHSWVPAACRQAPIPVAALLPAALDKILAVYLLLRVVALFDLPRAADASLMVLGALGIVTAMLLALVQRDMREMLAWSTIGQVGYIVLGIGTGTAVGLAGALFHAINNAVFKTCLFLGVGGVEQRVGSTDLARGGGLARRMPVTFACCAVASLAIAGIPPLSGFASKWMIYQGVIETGRGGSPLWIGCLVAAMLGSALTLATFLKLLHAVFLRKAPAAGPEPLAVREVRVSMWGPMVLLAALCVAFGIFAHALPLRYLIFPSLGGPVQLPGVWWAGAATAMLAAAFLAGAALYWVSVGGRIRRTETYIGGERMDETYIRGVDRDESRDVEVTGVDFYDTVRDVRPLRAFYGTAKAGRLDPYEWGRAGLERVTAVLGMAHSGSLTRYVAWSLLGVAALVFAL